MRKLRSRPNCCLRASTRLTDATICARGSEPLRRAFAIAATIGIGSTPLTIAMSDPARNARTAADLTLWRIALVTAPIESESVMITTLGPV